MTASALRRGHRLRLPPCTTRMPEHHEETPTERLDREFHACAAADGGCRRFRWRSPTPTGPGTWACRRANRWTWCARLQLVARHAARRRRPATGAADDDPRFRHEAWAAWPFNVMRAGFRNVETWWREAARLPGMTRHHADMTDFFARQTLGFDAGELAADQSGRAPRERQGLRRPADARHRQLARGLVHRPRRGRRRAARRALQGRPRRRRDAGQVVMRNRLVELIRYDAQTKTVHPSRCSSCRRGSTSSTSSTCRRTTRWCATSSNRGTRCTCCRGSTPTPKTTS